MKCSALKVFSHWICNNSETATPLSRKPANDVVQLHSKVSQFFVELPFPLQEWLRVFLERHVFLARHKRYIIRTIASILQVITKYHWFNSVLTHKIYSEDAEYDKKFKLVLTRRAKAYSSSCLQTVSLSPAISFQLILKSVHCSRRSQKSIKPLILEVQGLSKSSMLIWLKSSSLVLVVISSMPMPTCNHLHKKLVNNGKIMTFTGLLLFDALMRRFPWT